MKPAFLLIIVFSIAFASFNTAIAQEKRLSIMSYNIRYDNPDDTPNWDNRKDRVANLINFHQPAFVGTQEALYHQLRYLDQQLTSYSWIGKGRKDGKKGGEFSALLYDTSKVTLAAQSDSTIWLSKTPRQPSKSWDAAFPRILTWGKFQIKESGKTVLVFNTHFDHVGDTARAKSAEIILSTIQEVAGTSPVIVTGDFNITDESKPYKMLTSSLLSDAYYSSRLPNVGPDFTYSGFEVSNNPNGRRIDYIFTNNRINVQKHAIISAFNDGYYPSDHLPVVAEITIDNQE